MTTFLPLEPSKPLPPSPSFLAASSDPEGQTAKVIKAILKAKRVVIICGAGISVKAGIPDFRSPEGLFQTLKRDNPREQLSSGRDLFDASVFSSEQTTSLFCQMIARLSSLSSTATPTPFHRLLRRLNDRGRLLRVYTQNIDAIEMKAGLSFGVPEFCPKPRSKSKPLGEPSSAGTSQQPVGRLPSPPLETPRCIPLHGTLQTMHCQTCTHKFPLEDYLSSLESGSPPQCPECTLMEETRQVIGKRARGIGKLRPSVVLYNEMHQDGEGVGEVVQRDLMGSSKGKGRSGADLLLVVGTSLRVPGTKRMVREFAKAVRARASASCKDASPSSSTPNSPRRSPANEDEQSFKSIYLNLDFPVPTREWEGVFDAWLQGDAQMFASMVEAELKKEADLKEQASERKRKRDADAALAMQREADTDVDVLGEVPSKKGVKRKLASGSNFDVPSAKRRIIVTRAPVNPSKQQKEGRGASSLQSQTRTGDPRSGIILRIPPRMKLVPQVVITSTAPTFKPPNSTKKKSSRTAQVPLTPPQTPPRPAPIARKDTNSPSRGKDTRNDQNSTGRKPSIKTSSLALDANNPGRSFNASDISRHPSLSPLSPSPPLSAEPDEIADSMVRTLQYGLRGSAPG